MPGRTEKGIPTPLHLSLPPNPTAHSSYESGLQCPSPVPVPTPSLPCLCDFEQSHDLVMVSVDTSCTVTGVQGADACRGCLAPKHSVTTKDTFSLTPALLPQARESMQSKPLGSVLFSQAPPSQISAEVDREAAAPPHSVWETGGQWAESVSREAGCPGLLAPAATLCVLQGRRDRSGKTLHGNYGIGVFPLVQSDLPRTGAVGWPRCGQQESS